jgi:hypothetical protein
MTKKTIIGAAAVLAAVAALLAPAAGAATSQCSGVVTGTVDGNLVVPDGSWCVLAGAQVHGNVVVGSGAWLHAVSSGSTVTTIDGNVVGSDVKWVLLQDRTQVGGNFVVDGAATFYTGFDIDVRVGGNATITDNAGYTFVDAAIVGRNVVVQGGTGGVEVEWNRVGGNETVSNNDVPTTFSVYGNQVAGNLGVNGNTGGGHKQVIDNTAGRNLTCLGNDDPFVSSANTAQRIQGQCA